MFSKKNNSKILYKENVRLLAEKLLWLKEHHNINVLLLAGVEKNDSYKLIQDIYNVIEKCHNLSISLTHLVSGTSCELDIDWEHDLNLIYLDNVNQNFHLPSYIDHTLILIKASQSSRNQIRKAIDLLDSYQLKISGSILHNFKEKVPNIIKRIFF